MSWDRKGSTWHKWDFHVHTPASYEQKYGDASLKETWDKYVHELILAANTHKIEAICIQDYFTFDGYRRLIDDKYYDPEAKLLSCVGTDGQIISRPILILPGIELRLGTFGEKAALNVHFVFDTLDPNTLDAELLSKLRIESDVSLSKRDCIRDGWARLKTLNAETVLYESVPIEQHSNALAECHGNATIKDGSIEEWLDQARNNRLLPNRFIYVAAYKGHGGLSDLSWQGRQASKRRSLISQADALLSNSPRDRDFLLQAGKSDADVRAFVSRFSGLKPCIWGSDCHEYPKLLHPSNGNTSDYTWIKSDLSFQGLYQIKYEPESRVRIGPERPEPKELNRIISRVSYLRAGETRVSVPLNPNLNVIIGGKSTGKTLLLFAIGHALRHSEVARTLEKQAGDRVRPNSQPIDSEVEGRKALVREQLHALEVQTADDVVFKFEGQDAKPPFDLTFIPQSYVNSIVENSKELDKIVLDTLRGNSEFSRIWSEMERAKTTAHHAIEEHIRHLVKLREERYLNQRDHETNGTLESILKQKQTIEEEIKELRDSSGLAEAERVRYDALSAELAKQSSERSVLINRGRISSELEKAIQLSYSDSLRKLDQEKSKILIGLSPEHSAELARIVEDYVSGMQVTFAAASIQLSSLRDKFDVSFASLIEAAKPLRAELGQLHEKLKSGEVLIAKEAQLKQWKDREYRHGQLKQQLDRILTDIDRTLAQLEQVVTSLLTLRKEALQKMQPFFTLDGGLRIESSISFDRDSFLKSFDNLFDNRKSLQLLKGLFPDLKDRSWIGDLELERIASTYSQALGRVMQDAGKYGASIKGSGGPDWSKLLSIFAEDRYSMHFTLYDGRDKFSEMSPGKRGSVLLELLLEHSSGKGPILIDQPEDNLDNRTIFARLVKSIRKQKANRQVIIVTHNANLVVSTDAENIIVANQLDQPEAEKSRCRFEYTSGPLECSFKEDSAAIGLEGMGIREHVCEILEGGQDAFLRRQQRYQFK